MTTFTVDCHYFVVLTIVKFKTYNVCRHIDMTSIYYVYFVHFMKLMHNNDLCKLPSPLFSGYRGFFSGTEACGSWSWLLASILQRHMVLYFHSCIVCCGKTLPLPSEFYLTPFFCAFLMFYAIAVNECNSASTMIGWINAVFFVSYKPAKWSLSYIRTHTV